MGIRRILIVLPVFFLFYQSNAQCKLISHKYGSVYITFDRVGTIPLNEEKQEGIILRLRNNSTCAVTVSIEGTLDKPERYQLRGQRALPDVLYWLRIGDTRKQQSGDAFLLVTVPGGRSVLIGVPFDVLDEPDGLIEVPYRYKWEDDPQRDGSEVTTEHVTYFPVSGIPKNVISQSGLKNNK